MDIAVAAAQSLSEDVDPVAQFAVAVRPDERRLTRVADPRLFENRFASPQPFLLDVSAVDWHLAFAVDAYAKRRTRSPQTGQMALFGS